MSKTSVVMVLCGGFLCAVPACPQAGAISGSDQQFVNTAAQTDMTEAHVGQMAQDRGASQGVKDFGQTLVTDHTSDYTQLSTIVAKDGGTVPKGLDAAHDRMIAPFDRLKGAAFDHKFAQEMVMGHTKAIAEYRREAKDGQNADIKAYANQALPTLEKHLQMARDLAKSKGKKK